MFLLAFYLFQKSNILFIFFRLPNSMILYFIRIQRQKAMANFGNVPHRPRLMHWMRKMHLSKISYSMFVRISSVHWNEPRPAIENHQITTVIIFAFNLFIFLWFLWFMNWYWFPITFRHIDALFQYKVNTITALCIIVYICTPAGYRLRLNDD